MKKKQQVRVVVVVVLLVVIGAIVLVPTSWWTTTPTTTTTAAAALEYSPPPEPTRGQQQDPSSTATTTTIATTTGSAAVDDDGTAKSSSSSTTTPTTSPTRHDSKNSNNINKNNKTTCALFHDHPPQQQKPRHILILGGGLAGLAAARQFLLENYSNINNNNDKHHPRPNQWQITLLEGRNRLGGRVYTVNNKNNNKSRTTTPIDLGGMYFHGQWPHFHHHHHHYCHDDDNNASGNNDNNDCSNKTRMILDLESTKGTSAQPALGQSVWWIQKQQPKQASQDNNNNNNSLIWSVMTNHEKQQGQTLLNEWTAFMKQQQRQQAKAEQRIMSLTNNINNSRSMTTTTNNNNNMNTREQEESIIVDWWTRQHATFCQNLSSSSSSSTTLPQEQQQQAMLEFYLQMHFDLDRGVPFWQHTPTGLDTDWDWSNGGDNNHGDNSNNNGSSDDYVASHGMDDLIQQIVTSLSGNDNDDEELLSIHLNQKVVHIERYLVPDNDDTNGKTAKPSTTKWGCRVTTETTTEGIAVDKQNVWTADACVVTLPIGVLKQQVANGGHFFDPPLSRAKQSALHRAGVGTLNTVAVQWKRPVCDVNTTAHYMIPYWQNAAYNGTSSSSSFNTNPLRTGFVCPGVLRKQYMDRTITQFFTSETNLPFDNDTYWKEQAIQVVSAIVPTLSLQDIQQIHVSAWHLDPFSLGSYSAATTWTRGNEDRRELAKPEHNVWFFAGEHTHAAGRYQSSDGAYETGIRAAQQVHDYLLSLEEDGEERAY